jgi:Na+/melibiose symporter-like transporter
MVDAATFVVAAVAIASLRVVEHREEHEPMHWRAEVGAGVTHIRRTPVLLHSTLSLSICLLVVGFSESAIYAVVEAFDKPVEFVGPMLTVQGIGALAAGLLSSRVVRRLGEPRTIMIGLALLSAGVAGVAGAVAVWQLLLAMVVLGMGIPLMIVAYNTLLQRRTPGEPTPTPASPGTRSAPGPRCSTRPGRSAPASARCACAPSPPRITLARNSLTRSATNTIRR